MISTNKKRVLIIIGFIFIFIILFALLCIQLGIIDIGSILSMFIESYRLVTSKNI